MGNDSAIRARDSEAHWKPRESHQIDPPPPLPSPIVRLRRTVYLPRLFLPHKRGCPASFGQPDPTSTGNFSIHPLVFDDTVVVTVEAPRFDRLLASCQQSGPGDSIFRLFHVPHSTTSVNETIKHEYSGPLYRNLAYSRSNICNF